VLARAQEPAEQPPALVMVQAPAERQLAPEKVPVRVSAQVPAEVPHWAPEKAQVPEKAQELASIQ